MSKIAIVIGTRPEVVKLAPVILKAKERGLQVTTVFTGQHREMAKPILEFFKIVPDINLDVMTPNQTLAQLSAKVLLALDQQIDQNGLDWLFVQGDTTTAMIAAYWAFTKQIRVAHVEAGLRTYNLSSPFPEEANRQLISRIGYLHFAPTETSKAALAKEGLDRDRIFVVGNTGIDALMHVSNSLARGTLTAERLIPQDIQNFTAKKRMILVTAHRRESFGKPFAQICEGLRKIADQFDDVRLVYPVHLNPNVQSVVNSQLQGHPRILLTAPLDYLSFIAVMQSADVLLTDSGGIQEEGPTLRKPIVVMRENTERPEGVEAGFAKLVGTNPDAILNAVSDALTNGCTAKGNNPYGDGRTSEKIIKTIQDWPTGGRS